MSYVGGRFEYDVFFSYAYAQNRVASDLLGEWSRHVIDAIADRTALALNARSSAKRPFRAFRDTHDITAGMALTDTLEDAVTKAAIVVVLVSPFYWERAWCRQELAWWAKSSDDRVANSAYVIHAQSTPLKKWPQLLRDRDNKPFQSISYMGDQGLPAGVQLSQEEIVRKLDTQIGQTCSVICDRLTDKRKLLEAIERRRKTLEKVKQPLIFLESEMDDAGQRKEVYNSLKERKVKVLPKDVAGFVGAGGPMRYSPSEFYSACNSLVLLRSRENDKIELRMAQAMFDRNERLAADKPLALAVCNDLVGIEVPSADVLEIPVIDRTGDWVDRLLQDLS
jgi:hypothetical protein